MVGNHDYCIIMAGGMGSRFWPVSRENLPKQFLDFTGGGSFLRQAYDRACGIVPADHVIVVTLDRYMGIVLSQLPELPFDNVIIEPYNRNTAPCIAYAAYTLLARDPRAVMAVMPSDHLISDTDAFAVTMRKALERASSCDDLITLGVVPTRPDVSFGYIQMAGRPVDGGPVRVKTFTEKPSSQLAEVFVGTGEFLWNCGIFVWRASAIIDALEKFAPEITSLFSGWRQAFGTSDLRFFVEKAYSDMPRLSIDCAVMEKTGDAVVYPASFGWRDIGNWDSLYEYLGGKDDDGNAFRVEGMKLFRDDSRDIIMCSNPHKLVAVRGLDNFVVIDTDDVLMICPRERESLRDFTSDIAMPEYEKFR